MVGFLIKLYIKDYDNVESSDVKRDYGVVCAAVGVFLNAILFSMKFLIGTFSNSISIVADAFNNLSDAGSSLMTLIGFKMAGMEADKEHPYGHGRIEYLTGLLVSVSIIFMGFELIKSSVDKIIHPEDIEFSPLIVIFLCISIITKLYMAYYNKKIGNKIDSSAMHATSLDSISDVFATTIVLIITLINAFTSINIDGLCGVGVGVAILFAGIGATKKTISLLIGEPPKEEFLEEIREKVIAYDNILGVHDIIVHDYGLGHIMVSLHAEVPAYMNVLEVHNIIDCIEDEISCDLNCEIVIHVDPVCLDDTETIEAKKQISSILNNISDELTMHDFRISKKCDTINVVFDIVKPFDFKYNDKELKDIIIEEIKNYKSEYIPIIKIDKN